MSEASELMSLVEKLSREAQRASKTCGQKELDALHVLSERFVKLYRELKSRGVIE